MWIQLIAENRNNNQHYDYSKEHIIASVAFFKTYKRII
jgi:predicted oxidoreductase